MAEFFYFCGHEQFQPEVLVRHAKLAEDAGFDGVIVSEHFHPWVADLGASGFAFATLGAIAHATTRVKMITGVTTPLFRYHPAVIAQAAATIDRLSSGRFMLGIGTGEPINEITLGYTFPSYTERAERIIESIEIIKRLLQGEKVTFDGKYYKTKHAKLYSPPIGNVPIFMAAGGPNSAQIAGKYADGIITSVKDVQETSKNIIKPALEVTNKKLEVFATRWTVFGKTDEELYEALLPWRGLRVPSRNEAFDPLILQQEADSLPKSEIIKSYTKVSSSKDYIDVYTPLVKGINADYIGIQTTGKNQEKLIQMLGEEVLPSLRKLTDTSS